MDEMADNAFMELQDLIELEMQRAVQEWSRRFAEIYQKDEDEADT